MKFSETEKEGIAMVLVLSFAVFLFGLALYLATHAH